MKKFLIKDVQKIGLFIDNRGNLYGEKYKEYLNTKTGVWQHPEELVDFCLFLDGYDINSFLNIGTYNGLTFNFISNYLNKNKEVSCTTIDPINHNPVKDFRFTYLDATSQDFKGKKFDLVFIDGDHSYDSIRQDYLNVGLYAKLCALHDIRDEYCEKLNGGPMRLWKEIKDASSLEFFAEDKPRPYTMGIGVKIH
jgi:hypothetical protein